MQWWHSEKQIIEIDRIDSIDNAFSFVPNSCIIGKSIHSLSVHWYDQTKQSLADGECLEWYGWWGERGVGMKSDHWIWQSGYTQPNWGIDQTM